MDLLFLAYANSREAPLPTLREEEEKVYELLSRRAAQRHFVLHRDAHTDLGKIAEYLIRFREDLTFFSFSGHAGRDQLLLDDREARSAGIAELLGQCPRLQLVLLNGCSTAGQVRRLLQLPNCPAVIATSAPVADFAATHFSISFTQAFAEQGATIDEAFTAGLAAARTASASVPSDTPRGVALPDSGPAPLWGVYTARGYESRLDWRLPLGEARPRSADLAPNHFLVRGLLESLAPFDEDIKQLRKAQNAAAGYPGAKKSPADRRRRSAILKSLPFPISVHLQKLLAKRRASMEGHDFYDEFGPKRLQQLLHTYDTVIELPAFVLLSQLWDALADEKELRIDEIERQVIHDYFHASFEDRLRRVFFPLMRTGLRLLENHGITPFVPELANLPLADDTSFYDACQAVALLRTRLAEGRIDDWAEACITAEEKLTGVLGQFGFLARYALVSVRNIDVLRNRHIRTPNYLHRLVRLVQHFSEDPTEEVELLEDFLDNASVLLMKKEPLTGQNRFLNLTPFIIDENAYVERAEDHKLYYLHRCEPGRQAYCFRHIYKPDDRLLWVEKGGYLEELNHQFDVFLQLLADQAVRTL